VTIGSGVSYCLIVAGEPYSGANGYAIHFAQSPLTMRCDSCGALSRPIVEEIASGPGLVTTFAARGGNANSGEQVIAAAAAGDPAALEVVTDAAERLGVLIGLTVNMLDPQAVIIGGGLGLAGGLYRERLEAAARAHVWADSQRDLPIRSAALGADAGLVGAALAIARQRRA
jgi:glucokinase